MVEVAEDNKKKDKRGEKGEKRKKGGEKVLMSGLNIKLCLYVFIFAIANHIFNDVTVAALTIPIIPFMSQVHEVKGNHN